MVKGYKVFNTDWTCRDKQYSCPGTFHEDGELDVCGHGMHFCKMVSDCFKYYSFNPDNHVAEVIAHGQVKEDGDKCCTDDLEIVREIQWHEVLEIVNTGKNCTGICNTGDWNTGDRNTGNRNTGDCNTGNRNTGDYNTGNCNTGNRNTGNWNTGDRNTGNYNTGNRNTGDWNTGDRNTGDWNKSSFNTGCFCTEEQKIMLFNKPSDWSYNDWLRSDARFLLNHIPKNVVEWVYSSDMTDEEKAEHPTHETTGGYLKVLDESECAQMWWDGLAERDRNIIRSIPNFDPDIFYECTGIKVEE
jgi:hypothetical protein